MAPRATSAQAPLVQVQVQLGYSSLGLDLDSGYLERSQPSTPLPAVVDTYTNVLNNSVNAGDKEGSYQVQALRESLFVWGVWFGVAIANALASPNPHLLKQIISSCGLPLSASGSLVGEPA